MTKMDKELLAKYHLEEAVKRFNQINEYTFITSPLVTEDGEDDMGNNQMPPQDNAGNPQQPAQGGGQPDMNNQQQPPMGGENGGQMPPMDNGQNGGQQPPMPENGDMSMPPMEPMGDAGANPEDDSVETEESSEDDEVIDVDDLTQAQETSEIKIDGVDDKLTRVLNVLNKFTDAIAQNDKKIEDLKREFEIRNPSEQEKLNIRSQASYPYSETPKDYWDKKMENNPHYNVIYDNDVSTADEQSKFDITADDIKDNNYRDIASSFDINDDMSLEDFVKF